MATTIQLGEICAEVVLKAIRNVHLSVYPPQGRVRISAPLGSDLETVRVFALSKLPWIRRQQQKLQEQERETTREMINRESHYYRGRRYLLSVVETNTAPSVEFRHKMMVLAIRAGADADGRLQALDEWYRQRLKEDLSVLVPGWEQKLGVKADRVRVQRMKTRWGSCNHETRSILINLELAKKPEECLEYIVVHELVHLLEPRHDARFIAIMDRYMPRWRFIRDELNHLPVRHERWEY